MKISIGIQWKSGFSSQFVGIGTPSHKCNARERVDYEE